MLLTPYPVNKVTNIILLLLIAIALVVGVIFYPQLPDQVASHWNAAGEVNGYMTKFWGVFFLPILLAGLFLIYWIVPRIDPQKSNIQSFRKYYNYFWIVGFLFLLYIFGLQIAWNLGTRFNFSTAIIPAMVVLWYFVGIVIEKSKRNWFVGIRTPWTLSSDVVWEKTHKLGGKLFKLAALISLLGLLFPSGIAMLLIIAPVVIIAIITIVYSYVEYRKLFHKSSN